MYISIGRCRSCFHTKLCPEACWDIRLGIVKRMARPLIWAYWREPDWLLLGVVDVSLHPEKLHKIWMNTEPTVFFRTATHDQARFDFNVVPAQALMELFLAEEGAHHTGGSTATTHPYHWGQYHRWTRACWSVCSWWELKPFRSKHGWTLGLDHVEPQLIIGGGLTLPNFTVLVVIQLHASQCGRSPTAMQCWNL